VLLPEKLIMARTPRGTGRQTDKFLMMAGLGPKQVVENMFNMKTIVSKKSMATVQYPGTLNSRSEFDAFWTLMESKEKFCTLLLEEFLKKILQIVNKDIKLPPGIKMSSVLNTVQFLTLFYNYNSSSSKLKSLHQRITEKINKLDGKSDLMAVKEEIAQAMKIIDLHLELRNGSENADTLLRWFTNYCATQGTPEEFNKMRNFVSFSTFDPSRRMSGAQVFLFSFLKTHSTKPAYLKAIVGNTIKRIRAIPQVMKMNPKVAESSLLSYFQILYSIMIYGADIKTEQIIEAIQTIYQFYFWPKPIGGIAKDLLFMMERECLIPGQTLRDELAFEAVCARGKRDAGPLGQKEALVLHMVDVTCPSSSTFCHIMRIMDKDEKEEGQRLKIGQFSVPSQVLIMLNMMNFDTSISRKDLDSLLRIGRSDMKKLFDECQAVTEVLKQRRPEGMTPEESHEYRSQNFRAMIAKWPELAAQRDPGDEPISVDLKQIELNQLHDHGFPLIMPPFFHNAIKVDLKYNLVTPEQRKLAFEGIILPPESTMFEPLLKNIKKLMYGVSPVNKLTLRLILTGGDRLMHSFLCAYLRLLEAEPALAENVNFKFFVIPTGLNHLACFLARHDSWYNRHIYTPFWSDRFLLPWVYIDPFDKPTAEKEGNMMTKFFRDLVDNYVRNAKQTMGVKIWKCKVFDTMPDWDNKADKRDAKKSVRRIAFSDVSHAVKDEPSQIFPFFQRLEIGHGAELIKYCESEEKKMRKRLVELTTKRDLNTQEGKELIRLRGELRPENYETRRKKLADKFGRERYQTPELMIRFLKVGMDGTPVRVLCDQFMAFSQITLSNVPMHSDKDTFPPNPEDPWLEMFVKSAPSYSTKKNILNAEPAQHVSRVEIIVRSPTDSFPVLVDGQLFPQVKGQKNSGYKSIVIEKMLDSDDNQMAFPVQTFFPIKL